MTRKMLPNRYYNSILFNELLKLQPARMIDNKSLPEILFITPYPPRECATATYSKNLLSDIQEKFGSSFSLKVCALEGTETRHEYPDEVKYVLCTSELLEYEKLAQKINMDKNVALIFVQHEFALYGGGYGQFLLGLLCVLNKSIVTTFHTVLSNPDKYRKNVIQLIAKQSVCTVALNRNSADILEKDYEVPAEKITVPRRERHHEKNRRTVNAISRLILDKSQPDGHGISNQPKLLKT